MDCQECHHRTASLRFTQLIEGKEIDIHICEACAMKLEYMTYPEESYSLHNLLAGLFNIETDQLMKDDEIETQRELECNKCNLKLNEFKRVGKFGCAECYFTFSKQIGPILRQVHSGNVKHQGKVPKRQGKHLHIKNKVKEYQEKLKLLIENEEFEEAAIVRDKIKDIRNFDYDVKAGDVL